MLSIKDLEVSVVGKNILKCLNLDINESEVHVIAGPNGTGKSTLASVIMGDPRYSVDGGSIAFLNKDLLSMKVDERAREGVFLAMQIPSELSGVTNVQFLKTAVNARRDENDPIKLFDFYKMFKETEKSLNVSAEYAERHVNVGFSGGEKKHNEIFQMLMLEPKLIILDEIDSGLDIDAVRIVGDAIFDYFNKHKDTSIIIITHQFKILDYIKPDFVHIMKDGNIVKTGDYSLIKDIESKGYEEV